ncbi:MAG TPA: HNH endonuclease [Candidatus Baltobacteraceae bacterium]
MPQAPAICVAPTDTSWFSFLSQRGAALDEVNFWSPSGRALQAPRGTLFLFKLKYPVNKIAGGGFIDYSQRLTLRDAWEYYGIRNGADSLAELEGLISRYLGRLATADDTIGCTILSEPFFLSADEYVEPPEDWKPEIVAAKYYSFANPITARLLHDVTLRKPQAQPSVSTAPFGGVSAPVLRVPRRGQGTFRRFVLAAYGNQCAVTGEHTIPVLQASHIRPFAETLGHEVQNGIALRSDVHTLFDRGYVTVTPESRFLVSEALRRDFSNGKIYYKHHGELVHLPENPEYRPKPEYLEWHSDVIFKG